VFVTVLVRRLKPGKTLDDFVRVWYPDHGFGIPTKVFLGQEVSDDVEVVTIGLHDVDATIDELASQLERIADNEAKRHDRLTEIVESTTVRGFYEVHGIFDLTTEESVEINRP